MTTKIKSIYKSGLSNIEFLEEINAADGDEKPTLFSSDLEKHLFSAIYYGWLVSRYGINWKLHV